LGRVGQAPHHRSCITTYPGLHITARHSLARAWAFELTSHSPSLCHFLWHGIYTPSCSLDDIFCWPFAALPILYRYTFCHPPDTAFWRCFLFSGHVMDLPADGYCCGWANCRTTHRYTWLCTPALFRRDGTPHAYLRYLPAWHADTANTRTRHHQIFFPARGCAGAKNPTTTADDIADKRHYTGLNTTLAPTHTAPPAHFTWQCVSPGSCSSTLALYTTHIVSILKQAAARGHAKKYLTTGWFACAFYLPFAPAHTSTTASYFVRTSLLRVGLFFRAGYACCAYAIWRFHTYHNARRLFSPDAPLSTTGPLPPLAIHPHITCWTSLDGYTRRSDTLVLRANLR